MNEFTFKLILVIVSYIISIGILVFLLISSKKISQKTGKLIEKISDKGIGIQIVIIISSFILISLILFRDLKTIYNFVICAVGILGVYMASKEISMHNKNGIYQNALIAYSHFIFFDNIESIPKFNLDKEEFEQQNFQNLLIIKKKGGSETVNFISSEEGKKICLILKNQLNKK